MRLAFGRFLLGAALATTVFGQGQQAPSSSASSAAASRPSASPSPTAVNASLSALPSGAYVTTVVTTIAGANGQPSQTMTLTVTVPVASTTLTNSTALPTNGSFVNGTMTNGTLANGTETNTTVPWNDTMTYLPFTPHLDAAYGLGGGLLILSGVPVATLGGRNRWSALAVVSGYSVGLFCLIMIMSFGVTPALQPPSPQPPSASLRGLYLLAVGVSFLIGSALGIFFYTFAKYWVGAAGGFSLGWFIVGLHKGGLVKSVGPRWAIIGGLTVASLLAALTPRLHEYVLLISSAWVGATAFTLGIDCFTRVGLKEFYVYNLGYSGAFQSLNGGQFPLTQNMQVELGVVAAAAVIAAAVQFKVVSMLQKRRSKLAAQEEARVEAEEINKAAEHFKNVDAELAEWEGKYGATDSSSNTLAGTLGIKSARSSIPTLRHTLSTPSALLASPSVPASLDSPPKTAAPLDGNKRMSLLEEMGYRDDPCRGPDTPGTPTTPIDPELEQKLHLLAEVRRARQSIRSSMDHLRYSAGTPSAAADTTPSDTRPGTAFNDRPASPNFDGRSRHDSTTSVLDRGRYDSGASSLLLNNMGHERKGSAGSAHLLDDRTRHDSLGNRALTPAEPSTVATVIGNRLSLADVGRVAQANAEGTRPLSDTRPLTEWEVYVQSRNIVSPSSPQQQQNALVAPVERYAVVSDSVGRALNSRSPGAPNLQSTNAAQEYGNSLARAIASSERAQANAAAAAAAAAAAPAPRRNSSSAPRRLSKAMTTDELADRHREMLNKMQERVTGPIKQEQALASAKDEWEKRQREEREEQRRKERRTERGDTGRGPTITDGTSPRPADRPADRTRRTDEWRRSVATPARPTSPPRRNSNSAAPSTAAPSGRPPTTRRSSRQFIA